jgi:hypothetical protein
VYQNDASKGFYFYNTATSTWTLLASNDAWSTAGNTGINSGNNFLGTIDNSSLKIRTNNTQRMLFDSLGNIGIGTSPTFSISDSLKEKLLVDAGLNPASSSVISGRGNANRYLQLNIQNYSSGAAASSDIVASNNAATELANFINMGINSSGYADTAMGGILGGPSNAYLYSTGNDFILGNASSGKNLRFFTGGTSTGNERMGIDGTGNLYLRTVQTGASADSLLTIKNGVVKRLSPSALTTSSSNAWALVGNTGSATTKLGTTEAFDLPIITSNTTRMTVTSNGNVGIGTTEFDVTTPEKLLVNAGTNPVNGVITNLTPVNAIGATNGFQQIQVQNRSYGKYSSSDLVAANDGTRAGTVPINTDSYYVDLGINSSGYNNNNSNILNQPYTT